MRQVYIFQRVISLLDCLVSQARRRRRGCGCGAAAAGSRCGRGPRRSTLPRPQLPVRRPRSRRRGVSGGSVGERPRAAACHDQQSSRWPCPGPPSAGLAGRPEARHAAVGRAPGRWTWSPASVAEPKPSSRRCPQPRRPTPRRTPRRRRSCLRIEPRPSLTVPIDSPCPLTGRLLRPRLPSRPRPCRGVPTVGYSRSLKPVFESIPAFPIALGLQVAPCPFVNHSETRVSRTGMNGLGFPGFLK